MSAVISFQSAMVVLLARSAPSMSSACVWSISASYCFPRDRIVTARSASFGMRQPFGGEDAVCDPFRNRRDDAVAEAAQAVHPRGYPMSHSTKAGFRLPLTPLSGSGGEDAWTTRPSSPFVGTFAQLCAEPSL